MLSLVVDRRARVEEAVREHLGACPAPFLDRFFELALAPAEAIAARAQLVLDKPYGRNHILESSGDFGLSFAVMNPGQTTSYHHHERRREFFLVRRGTLTLRSGDAELRLEPGSTGSSVPLVPHALSNRGTEVVEFLEIFSPPLLDDKVRISDPYRRPVGRVSRHQ